LTENCLNGVDSERDLVPPLLKHKDSCRVTDPRGECKLSIILSQWRLILVPANKMSRNYCLSYNRRAESTFTVNASRIPVLEKTDQPVFGKLHKRLLRKCYCVLNSE
jgi:hypothetical protein